MLVNTTSAEMRERVQKEGLIDIHLLELIGIIVTAMLFSKIHKPLFLRDPVWLRGDNQSAVSWLNKRGGNRERRGAALLRVMGAVESSSDWCFEALHVRGVNNERADAVSRLPLGEVQSSLPASSPGVVWKQVSLPLVTSQLITEALVWPWQPQQWGRDRWSAVARFGTSG